MRILQVNKLYYPEIGGIEKIVQQIAEGLSKKTDIKVEVLVCQKKGRGTVEQINNVTIHRAGSFGVLASMPVSVSFLWQFKKLAKKADIVHFHMPFPLGDLAFLLSGYKGKTVVYWHSDVVKQKKLMCLYRPIMERFLKKADLILVAAEGTAKGSAYLRPYLDKCRVVPFAVEDDVLASGAKSMRNRAVEEETAEPRLEIPAAREPAQVFGKKLPEILFIGRLVGYKGCDVLLEAFWKMKQPAHLTIVGTGELEEGLKRKSRNLGIERAVTFCGGVPEAQKREKLARADIFVLPSVERSEAFGLVQLEAMAYGIPVINTNLPSGVPEVSVHGETGLTVQPGDPSDLARAMDRLAGHADERRRMGLAARKRVEERYTEEKMIDNMLHIYLELASQPGQARERRLENRISPGGMS